MDISLLSVWQEIYTVTLPLKLLRKFKFNQLFSTKVWDVIKTGEKACCTMLRMGNLEKSREMKSPFSSSQKCKNKGCSIPKLSPLGAHIPIFLNYSYCSSHYKRLQRMATGSLFLGRKCELNSFKTAPFLLYFISSSKQVLKLASHISKGKCSNTVNVYNTSNTCKMCVIHIVTYSQSMDTDLPSFFFLSLSFLGSFCLAQAKPSSGIYFAHARYSFFISQGI